MKKGRLEEIDDEGGFKITALSRFLRIKSLKKSIEGGACLDPRPTNFKDSSFKTF